MEQAVLDSIGAASASAEVNGVRVHYLRAREPSGPPVLLLHGWPEFCLTWRRNFPVLGRSYDVVAPDFRGFGASAKLPGPPASRDYAEDILALADHLAAAPGGGAWKGRVAAIGHDVGAWVMQAMARLRPDRFAGLFFFNCPYPGIGRRWVENGQFQEIWYQSFNRQPWAAGLVGSSREACRLYIGHFLRHWSHDPAAFDDDLETWVDNFLQPGALQGGFDWYRAVAEERRRWIAEGAPDLPPIEVPARVLWGRHDPVLRSEWTEGLERYFSDLETGIAEDAGHFVHYERPGPANDAMLAFLGRVFG